MIERILVGGAGPGADGAGDAPAVGVVEEVEFARGQDDRMRRRGGAVNRRWRLYINRVEGDRRGGSMA